MPRYQPTAADLLDDEPPASPSPAEWPVLPSGHSYGVARPYAAGDLVHIWHKAGSQHRAACGATTTKGVLPSSRQLGAVLCHQCRQAAPVAGAEPEPEPEAPLTTVAELDALPAQPAARLAAVRLDRIRIDGGTQARAGLNPDTVAEYAAAMNEQFLGAPGSFPPVVVFFDGADYWLADGFHRVAAYKESRGDAAAITADVRAGTRRDAVLYAVGANATHGLRRTREDVRRAIDVLLRDQEWGTWSDREIARQVGCDHKTVAAMRERLGASGEIPQIEERTVQRAGTTYTQAPKAAPAGLPADLVIADMQPRAAALGYTLIRDERGYVLSGPSLEPAIFMGRKGLDDYLAAREKEAAKAPAPALVDGPEGILLRAGWQPHPIKPLAWAAPGVDAQGQRTELEFDDAAELGRAAAIVASEPDIDPNELAERLTIIAALPPAVKPAANFRTTCKTCGKPFTNGQFDGQCGPCYRGGAKAPAAESAEPEPVAAAPADGIPIDVRVLAEAHGLLLQSAAPEDGFYLYWPWEKDQTDAFIPFSAEWARDWIMSDGPAGSERLPDCLATRASAAGWNIVGAHADGRLIVMPASDETYTVTEEISVADLEARIAPVAEPAPASPYVSIAPTPHTSVTVMPAPGETVAAAVAANRDNPAWQAGNGPIDRLIWGIVELQSEGEEIAAGDVPRALHLARQLVALLELAADVPADFQTPLVYRRVAELEGLGRPLNAVELRDLDDVTATLEDLAGALDDASYEDLAARLRVVRGRKAAA